MVVQLKQPENAIESRKAHVFNMYMEKNIFVAFDSARCKELHA
jgi:hypothetical protein